MPPNPLRIVYVLTSLGVGGAERQVAALAECMKRRGHAVSFVVLRPRLDEEVATALPVLHLDLRKSPGSLFAALGRARATLLDLRPDIVHSHSFHANIFARLLHLTGSAPAVVSTIHNVYEGGNVRMLAYRLTDTLSRHTTAVSHAAARRFVEMKAVPRRKISVVTNAIDLARFAPDLARRTVTRDRMLAGEEFIWLAAGRLTPAKDYPNLLHAFAQARVRSPRTSLWIAGQGTSAELAGLEALAASLHLEKSVRWLGLCRDLIGLYDAADGLVLSSAWEGLPLVVAEAMAMEKPVVATDVGGVRELIGECGSIVPAQNPDPGASDAIADATTCRRPPQPGSRRPPAHPAALQSRFPNR